jgi:uncharacterized protein YdhG (YjbR/CyaY superfamily)
LFVSLQKKNKTMEATAKKYKTVTGYLSAQPKDIKAKLQELRSTILKAAPGAEEVISYNIPAFKLNGLLVWYAAFKSHIGFYPRGSGIEAFKKELSKYKFAKGSVQFPLDQPLPLSLVTKIVKFRVEQNKEKSEGFLALLGAPAKRAFEHNGITTLKKLSRFTEKELLALHGVGPSTIPVLEKALAAEKLSFKK